MKKKTWVAWCVRLGSLALVTAVAGNLASAGTQTEPQQAQSAGDTESANENTVTPNEEFSNTTPVPAQPGQRGIGGRRGGGGQEQDQTQGDTHARTGGS